MRVIAITLVAISVGAAPCLGAELNKCTDRAGRVTYASESCESQGLKRAGSIRDRTTVVPGSAPAAARKSDSAKAAAKIPGAGESELGGSPVQIKPVNPLIEKLLK